MKNKNELTEAEKIAMYRTAFAADLGSNFTDPTTDAQHDFADKIGSRALSELRAARKSGKPYTKASYFNFDQD
jgi:hypothetical protein